MIRYVKIIEWNIVSNFNKESLWTPILGNRVSNMAYAYIPVMQIITRHFVTFCAYFRGEITTLNCAMVNESTIIKEQFIATRDICCPTVMRVWHVLTVSRCLMYIIVKHVAYIGCCVVAVKISAIEETYEEISCSFPEDLQRIEQKHQEQQTICDDG